MTEAEIIEQLLEFAQQQPEGTEPGTFTMPMFRKLSGMTESSAKRTLNELVDNGYIVRAKILSANAWGDVKRVPGYRLIEHDRLG